MSSLARFQHLARTSARRLHLATIGNIYRFRSSSQSPLLSHTRQLERPWFSRLLSIRANDSEPPFPSIPNNQKPSATARLKAFFAEYGKVGIGVYLAVSFASFSSLYLLLRFGVDLPLLLVKLGIPKLPLLENAGTVAVAYGIHKLLLPFRLVATVALTGWVTRRLHARGYMLPPRRGPSSTNDQRHSQ